MYIWEGLGVQKVRTVKKEYHRDLSLISLFRVLYSV